MTKKIHKIGYKTLAIIAFGFSVLTASAVAISDEMSCISQAPDARYQVLPGGDEVRDLQTNLVWKRCPEGVHWNGSVCEEKIVLFNWTQALAVSEQDPTWRIPSTVELASIQTGRFVSNINGSLVYDGCIQPAINTNLFPQVAFTLKTHTWTSTNTRKSYKATHNLWMGSAGELHSGNSTKAKLRLVRDFIPN